MLWISFFVLILSKNFLNFDAIEKQSIINLNRFGRKGYVSVVRGDSQVTFLGEGEDATFCTSLYCFLAIYGVEVSEQ